MATPHELLSGEAKRVSFNKDAAIPAKDPKNTRSGRHGWKVGSRYELQRKLGAGSFGCVCEAHDKEKDRLVAIKKNIRVFDDAKHCRCIVREVSILAMLQPHENIVRLYDVVAPFDEKGSFNEIYLVMEVCDTDLRLLCKSEVRLTHLHVRRILYTLLVGIKYLHSGGIYHRDLKPANCLMNMDCTVKICDFGLSRAVGKCDFGASRKQVDCPGGRLPEASGHKNKFERHLTGHVCTRWYRAPELILLQEHYTEAIDIWSVGCIYAELLGLLEGATRLGPLFPGGACYPLSHSRDDARVASGDQLEMIFDVIGTPSDAEVEWLDHEEARQDVRSYRARKGKGIKAKVPEADEESLDVLEQTLRFSAPHRASICELMEHRILAEVRDEAKERLAPGILKLKFDSEPDDIERLRKYLVLEVQRFHPTEASL